MEISTGNFKLLKRAWAAKSYLVWLLLGLSLVGTAFSATLSSNAIVRIAYIVPANRDPQPHAVSTLRSTVLLYQRWLADQMQRSGFGPKTFTVETELDGVTPLIHVLSVPPTDEFLRGDVYGGRVLDAARESGLPIGAPGQLWWLIPETHFQFPDGSISGGFDFGQRSPAAPMDGGWAISGSQNLALYRSIYHTNSSPYEGVVIEDIGFYPLVGDVSFPWFEGATFSAISSSALGGGLRSFGEALGLDPDYRNDENFNGNLMGFGFRGIRGVFYPDIYPYNYCSLSYASALALAVNPFLNPDRPVIDTNAPAITITTTGVRASANGLLHITFQASDHTSLHAALLQWERDSVFEMVEEITLSGANVTQTFATPYFNPEETNRYTITVFDSAGNRRSAQTAIYPQATINRSPQPFVFVAPLVAGLGEDIVFDASATFDPVHSANLLEVEWDFDGDGHFDTFPTTQSLQTNNYFSLGTRLIRARITDPAGATAVSAPVAVSITLCPTTLSPLTRLHGFSGSTGAIQVAVGPKCNWWVVNTNAWITILSGESGIGSGEVIYTVQPNPLFAERQGTLLIGDELFLVRQRAIECTFSLSPANRFHGFGIGPNTFKVTAKSGCAWQVVNTNTWIAITSGASGVSTGAVSYAIIAENRVAGRRSGNLVVGDEIFTVNQWGTNCELVLNLASRTHSANSESGDLSVSTANGCAWQVENTNLWISFDAMLGANSSSLRYTVAANTSPLPRSGVVLINGQPFTVLQEACSYSLAPANRSHTYLGQAGTFTVNSASVCPWSVSTTHSWITLLSGPGTGPGVVVYAVSQNPSGSPRSGTIKVANVDFIVSQSGKPCSYALTSDEVAYGEKGGVGEVFVGTETGCPWSVENTASWITITSEATGSGPGRVTYLVSTNTGLERRSTLTIAGQAYAVSQSAGLRTIAAGAMSVASSRTNCLPVTLEARGGENILAFSMCFDTNLLIFRRAHWQTGSIAGATLTVNSSQASQGRVGITFALPAGAGMTSGAQAVIQVCLSARSVTGRVETAISMCDAPVTRRLNDAAGRALPAAFAGGSVQVLGLCTLGEALDAPHLNWTSSSISWSCQTNVVHDAEDAAVSGVFDDDDDSYMEATVTGPGVLSFWWKVSSELNGDILRLYRAGSEQFRISGEVDWEWRQLSIPAGNQVLRWRYSKNGSGFAGADRAWVDQVSFEPAPPTITTQPAHRSVDEGSSITFSVTASGQAPLSYQWLRNGIALPEGGGIRGTRSATLTLSNVQPAQAGFYSVIVGTTGGNVASAAASLSIIPAVLLGEALDAAHLGWFTNGTMGWIGQSGVGRDGVDAARSGPVTHSQSSSLNTVLYGPGTLRFWWKVSSQEDDDRLVFYTNGVEQARLSGEVDWVQRTQTIGAGSNALRWTYSKSSSTSEGQDRAWVDQVEFAPTPVGISSQPANQAVDPGATAVFAVSVSGAPAFTYQWRFNGADLLNSALVRGATTATLTLSNVQAAQAGFYSVLVRNPSGETLSSDASLQVTELVPLPDALDATSFVWTTNGTPPWVGQTAVTRDGSDAARSGRIGDSRTNSFQTTVTGPGSISFWWKVSCETNNDRLRFFVNNSEQQSISGEMDWTWRSFAVGSGNQILEWRYTKNSSVFAGQDRGWVDQINYVPANSPTSPVIALQPTNRTIVAPAAVSFISFAVGSAPLNYQWLFDGEPLANGNGVSGATTTNLTITNSSAAHGGDYSLLVANAAGAVTSSVAKLTVITSPRIVTQPLSQNVLAGSTNTFNATARGTAPLFYQWLRSGTNLINGGNISGATSTNLRLTGVVAANAGSYFFVVTNSAGAATSVVATLTVSTAPSITSQPASRTLPAGSTASFSVTAAGSAPLSFQWRRNGVDLSDGNGVIGSTAATLWISNVQVAASGTYSVVIKNPVGQIVSANAALTAVLPPVIVVQPLGQSVAENATATLTVAASGAAPITYQWRCNGTNVVNGNGLSGATNATLTFTNAHPSRAGVYSVEVSNPGGSVSSADAPLVVIPKITLAEAVNAPYLEWTTKTNAPWIAQTNVTHDGEFAAQSATIAGSNNTWIETMVVGPGTIRFWWKVSSQTNADTLAFSLNGAEWSRISGGVDWQKMSFPVPAGPLTLRWTYTKDAAVTSGFDRAWLDEVDFLPNTAPSAPVIVSQPGSADLDLGSTATFAVEALGTGPLNYQWRFEGQNIGDDVNVLGASSPTLRLFNVQAAQSGLYDVVVRNAYSLQISQPAYLNVLTTIPLEFALDTENTNLLWRTGGYSPWLGQTKLSSDNFDSAQSSPVAHRATNWVETILPGPC
ncbi:MAG TPA: immunoglobulin domain-containing protein, partial [Methylomirabilota bacterium]|nr:immunoglobulin domain-containing protein [Methylomirabilota bacterium]